MPLKLNSTGGGSVTLDVPSTASALTVTVPAVSGTVVTTGSTAVVSQTMIASGVAGNGPAFSAYQSSQQYVAAYTDTKLLFQTERFDFGNCYDTTNSRFTPGIAGYYLITGGFAMLSSACGATTVAYKNGSSFVSLHLSISGTTNGAHGSAIVYMNGTTDYIELYGALSSAQNTWDSPSNTYFSGVLVRAA